MSREVEHRLRLAEKRKAFTVSPIPLTAAALQRLRASRSSVLRLATFAREK